MSTVQGPRAPPATATLPKAEAAVNTRCTAKEFAAELEGAAAACDWSDDEDASHDNDAWKDAFDREVTRRPHRGVARDCLVP